MIVVDTSVWIDYLRGRDATAVATMRELLDADAVLLPVPVRVELLGGVSKEQRSRLRRALSALRLVYPSRGTWALMERWAVVAAAAGDRFGVGDLLIGAMASEVGASLWSIDGDFLRMGSLGFVECFQPARPKG